MAFDQPSQSFAFPRYFAASGVTAVRNKGLLNCEVDLWSVPLPAPSALECVLARTLSLDEQKRAANYISPAKRSEFIAGRGMLRHLLALYLETPAVAIELSALANGKPALQGKSAFFFNLSHTEGLLLVAIANGMEVGVDVEKVRPIEGVGSLAARYFSAHERAAMDNSLESFFRLWTCRESALKAFGTGISAGWTTVRFVDRSRDLTEAIGPSQSCHIRHFAPRAGYVASIAALSPNFHVRQMRTLEFTDLEFAGAFNDRIELF